MAESRQECADLAASLGLVTDHGKDNWKRIRGGARHVLGSLCVEIIDRTAFAEWSDGLCSKPIPLGKAECLVSHFWESRMQHAVKEVTNSLAPLVEGTTQDVSITVADFLRRGLEAVLPLTPTKGALILNSSELPLLLPFEGWELLSVNNESVHSQEAAYSLVSQLMSARKTRGKPANGKEKWKPDDLKDKAKGAEENLEDLDTAILDDCLVTLRFRNSVANAAYATLEDNALSIHIHLKEGVSATAICLASGRHDNSAIAGFPVGHVVSGVGHTGTVVITPHAHYVQCTACVVSREMEEQKVARLHRRVRARRGLHEVVTPLPSPQKPDEACLLDEGTQPSQHFSEDHKRVNYEVHIDLACPIPYTKLKDLSDLCEVCVSSAFKAIGGVSYSSTGCGASICAYTRRVFPAREGERREPLHSPHVRHPRSVWRSKLDAMAGHDALPNPSVEVLVVDVPKLPPDTIDAVASKSSSPDTLNASKLLTSMDSVLRSASEGEDVQAEILMQVTHHVPGFLGIRTTCDDIVLDVRVSEIERVCSSQLQNAMGRVAGSNKRLGVLVTDTANRAVVREEDVKHVKHVFEAIDYDGSGYLSLKELISFSAAHPKAVPNSVFKYVGAGSAHIGFPELLRCHFPKCSMDHIENAVEQWCPQNEAEPALTLSPETLKEVCAVFEALDKDKKGYLTDAQVQRVFDDPELGKATDATITLAEFTSMVGPYFLNQTEMTQLSSLAQKRKFTNMDWTSIFPCGSAATYLVSPYDPKGNQYSQP